MPNGKRSKKGKSRVRGEDEGQLPNLRVSDENPVVAVICSDLHLSDEAPVSRAEREDWQNVQFGYVGFVWHACNRLRCPLLIPGDIFDRWKVSPKVVNRAIAEFQAFDKRIYAIPGNHDLRHHSLEDLAFTSFGTLVESKAIVYCPPGKLHKPSNLTKEVWPDFNLYAFPYGSELSDCKPDPMPNIALIHDYIWTKDMGFPGAPEAKLVSNYQKRLRGYSTAFFGDNHIPFMVEPNKKTDTIIVNTGCLIPRKINEADYGSHMALLHEDGAVQLVEIPIKAQWIHPFNMYTEEETNDPDVKAAEAFIEMLAETHSTSIDYGTAVRRWFEKTGLYNERVGKIIEEVLE